MYKIVPVQFPANAVTVLANCAAVFAFLVSWRCYATGSYRLLWLSAAGIAVYLLGDDFDGCQARRSNTSSAFGEFLDHFLDSVSGGLAVACLLFAYGITNRIVVFSAFFCLYASQTMTFLEKRETGVIYFGKLTSDEALILTIAGLVCAGFPPVREIATRILFDFYRTRWSAVDLLLLAGALGSLSTFFSVAGRMRPYRALYPLTAQYLVCSATVIALCGALPVPPALIFILIVFYQTVFCGMVLLSTVTGKTPVFPDYALPALLIYGKLAPLPAFVFPAAAGYLALFASLLFFLAFREYFPEIRLRVHKKAVRARNTKDVSKRR